MNWIAARPMFSAPEHPQQDAEENGGAEPVVVVEGAKAPFATAGADHGEVPDGDAGGKDQPHGQAGEQIFTHAHPGQQQQCNGIAGHDGSHVETAEGDGGGADADLQVVVTVDHRIFGVIGDGPEDVGQQHDPGAERNGIRDGCIRHRNAETEGNAQIRLRNGKEALEEGIAAGKDGSYHRQRPHERAIGKHQRQRQQAEDDEHGHGFPRGDDTAGQRAIHGALDGTVEIPIGEVVDRAAGGAHEHGAEAEGKERIGWRPAVGSHEQCPQRGPDQQQDADGFVQAREAVVMAQALQAGMGRGRRHGAGVEFGRCRHRDDGRLPVCLA